MGFAKEFSTLVARWTTGRFLGAELGIACSLGRADLVARFLARGASPTRLEKGISPMAQAAWAHQGDGTECMKLLRQAGAPLPREPAAGEQGLDLAQRAAYAGRWERLAWLESQGWDLSAPPACGDEVAAWLACSGCVEGLEAMRARGFDPAIDGAAPMRGAIRWGAQESVRWLLEQGADPNAVVDRAKHPMESGSSQSHESALSWAADASDSVFKRKKPPAIPDPPENIVRMLLDAGADPKPAMGIGSPKVRAMISAAWEAGQLAAQPRSAEEAEAGKKKAKSRRL